MFPRLFSCTCTNRASYFGQSRPSPYTCAGPLCWFQSRSIPVSVRVGAKSDRAHTLCCSAVIDACTCEDQRNEESNATQQTEDTTTAKPRAAKTERMRIMTPIVAPANIASTEASRRCQRGLLPWAREESAARPVMVNVNTVVVRSGTTLLLFKSRIPRRSTTSFPPLRVE